MTTWEGGRQEKLNPGITPDLSLIKERVYFQLTKMGEILLLIRKFPMNS